MARVYPEHQWGVPIRIGWLHTPTDRVETAAEVSPSMRWAGWLISARAAGDEARFYELLRTPAEGAQLGDGIMALLHLVAHSLANTDLVHAAEHRVGGEGNG
jgi:hypothetical protein